MWTILGSLWLGFMPITVDSPKEITPEWEERILGIKYGVTDLPHVVQEMTEGLIDEYFGKDFIERINAAIEKNPSGEFVEYWENGNMKAKLPYKNKRAHGHLHAWYDNGVDAFKGHFNEGIKQGTHITFFRTESMAKYKEARILRFDSAGKFEGKQKRNHLSGRLCFVIKYENGMANGPLESWNDDNLQVISADYKNGVLMKDPPPPPGQRGRPKIQEDERLVNRVIASFGKEIAKEFGAVIYGVGARMPLDVETIGLQITIERKVGREEARRLLVTLMSRLAERVNQSEELIPYLREYPFSPLRADISLSFCQKNGKEHTDGSIQNVIVGKDDVLFYDAYNPITMQRKTVFQEPYSEARKIVMGEGGLPKEI